MLRFLPTFILLSHAILSYGQSTQIKYFTDEFLTLEVNPEHAKYKQTITRNLDGTFTSEVINVKRNAFVKRETYRGEEPFGIWIYKIGKDSIVLDYDFELEFGADSIFKDHKPELEYDLLQDNVSAAYIAPKIATGESDFSEFVANRIKYPVPADIENMEGEVYVAFTIGKSGSVRNILVRRGAPLIFAKESVRVIRELEFLNPPMWNGEPQSVKYIYNQSFVTK